MRHRHTSRRFRGVVSHVAIRLVCLVFVVLLGLAPASGREPEPRPVQEVKAAFLYNFAKFVEWPGESDGEGPSHLRLCVIGDDLLGEALRSIVEGRTVRGMPIVVDRPREIVTTRDCHAVYIGLEDPGLVREILQSLRGRPVLTVGEGEYFTRSGGMVRFLERDNRMRFEINADETRSSSLRVSSRLLQVADVVGNEESSR